MVSENLKERQRNDALVVEERELNDKIINTQIAKEREKMHADLEIKRIQAEKIKEYMSMDRDEKNRRKLMEMKNEKTHFIENEKVWDMKYTKYQSEENARRDFMRLVYSERADQIRAKEATISRLKAEYQDESRKFLAQVQSDEIEMEKERIQIDQNRREYKRELLEQIKSRSQQEDDS